jgi:polyferredoxin
MAEIKTRYFRYSLLVIILGLVTYLSLGYGSRSFEAYCPFGGAESLWGLFTQGEFSCALGPLNLSLMLGLIGLVILSKKSFCGWACPIGFLGELSGRLSKLVWKRGPNLPAKVDSYLKLLRYVVLVVSLYYTYRLGELVLRGYDPFYLIFSGFGHGSAGVVSIIVFGILVLGAFIFPMFFCRYLCPLGAVFDPFSKLGLIKINRNESSCTACGECTAACPHGIQVETMKAVRHRDCTNCLECLDACPEKGTLELKAGL